MRFLISQIWRHIIWGMAYVRYTSIINYYVVNSRSKNLVNFQLTN